MKSYQAACQIQQQLYVIEQEIPDNERGIPRSQAVTDLTNEALREELIQREAIQVN